MTGGLVERAGVKGTDDGCRYVIRGLKTIVGVKLFKRYTFFFFNVRRF